MTMRLLLAAALAALAASGADAQDVCCMANTASCLACAAHMTVADYCAQHPTTPGCDGTGVTVPPYTRPHFTMPPITRGPPITDGPPRTSTAHPPTSCDNIVCPDGQQCTVQMSHTGGNIGMVAACRPLRTLGQACGSTMMGDMGSCAEGLTCACVGMCANHQVADAPSTCVADNATTTATPSSVTAGPSCDSDGVTCPSGQWCREGTCADYATVGQSCNEASLHPMYRNQCAPGLVCNPPATPTPGAHGTCGPAPSTTQAATTSSCGPCIALYRPVCGSNGRTFSNACMARCAGVESFTEGECGASTTAVFDCTALGCDDGYVCQTVQCFAPPCPAMCVRSPPSTSVPMTRSVVPFSTRTPQACSPQCPDDQYCREGTCANYATVGQSCNEVVHPMYRNTCAPSLVCYPPTTPMPGAQGTCGPATTTPLPVTTGSSCMCPRIYRPVCGSNGVTYSNDCIARCHGITSYTQGTCSSGETSTAAASTRSMCTCAEIWRPVCGPNGSTYSNACMARCRGVTSFTEGACTTPAGETTGTGTGTTCVCPMIYRPVCGSDGVTYSNNCLAGCAGITSYVPGRCPGLTTPGASTPSVTCPAVTCPRGQWCRVGTCTLYATEGETCNEGTLAPENRNRCAPGLTCTPPTLQIPGASPTCEVPTTTTPTTPGATSSGPTGSSAGGSTTPGSSSSGGSTTPPTATGGSTTPSGNACCTQTTAACLSCESGLSIPAYCSLAAASNLFVPPDCPSTTAVPTTTASSASSTTAVPTTTASSASSNKSDSSSGGGTAVLIAVIAVICVALVVVAVVVVKNKAGSTTDQRPQFTNPAYEATADEIQMDHYNAHQPDNGGYMDVRMAEADA